ncbi:hypothetical protein DFH09DRAFT_1297890 [Mycena vulgaris]|nr:hypothetical protein DFH09DRAFT_1297890 [Mycena vulgaris]
MATFGASATTSPFNFVSASTQRDPVIPFPRPQSSPSRLPLSNMPINEDTGFRTLPSFPSTPTFGASSTTSTFSFASTSTPRDPAIPFPRPQSSASRLPLSNMPINEDARFRKPASASGPRPPGRTRAAPKANDGEDDEPAAPKKKKVKAVQITLPAARVLMGSVAVLAYNTELLKLTAARLALESAVRGERQFTKELKIARGSLTTIQAELVATLAKDDVELAEQDAINNELQLQVDNARLKKKLALAMTKKAVGFAAFT